MSASRVQQRVSPNTKQCGSTRLHDTRKCAREKDAVRLPLSLSLALALASGTACLSSGRPRTKGVRTSLASWLPRTLDASVQHRPICLESFRLTVRMNCVNPRKNCSEASGVYSGLQSPQEPPLLRPIAPDVSRAAADLGQRATRGFHQSASL